MLFQHSFLDNILLAKSVINVLEFVSSQELIFGVEGMGLTICLGALLQRVWLRSYDIILFVRYSESPTFTAMEVSEALRADFAPVNISGIKRCVCEAFIFPCWRQDDRDATEYAADLDLLLVLIPDCVGGLQRIDVARRLEVDVRNVPVIHLAIVPGTELTIARSMSLLGSGAINVFDIEDVPRREIELLLFEGASAWDVVDAQLITDKLGLLMFNKCNALQVVLWIEGVRLTPRRGKLHALWLGKFDVVCSQAVFCFGKTDVKLPGYGSVNVPV